jgi:hypothetical protein
MEVIFPQSIVASDDIITKPKFNYVRLYSNDDSDESGSRNLSENRDKSKDKPISISLHGLKFHAQPSPENREKDQTKTILYISMNKLIKQNMEKVYNTLKNIIGEKYHEIFGKGLEGNTSVDDLDLQWCRYGKNSSPYLFMRIQDNFESTYDQLDIKKLYNITMKLKGVFITKKKILLDWKIERLMLSMNELDDELYAELDKMDDGLSSECNSSEEDEFERLGISREDFANMKGELYDKLEKYNLDFKLKVERLRQELVNSQESSRCIQLRLDFFRNKEGITEKSEKKKGEKKKGKEKKGEKKGEGRKEEESDNGSNNGIKDEIEGQGQGLELNELNEIDAFLIQLDELE